MVIYLSVGFWSSEYSLNFALSDWLDFRSDFYILEILSNTIEVIISLFCFEDADIMGIDFYYLLGHFLIIIQKNDRIAKLLRQLVMVIRGICCLGFDEKYFLYFLIAYAQHQYPDKTEI